MSGQCWDIAVFRGIARAIVSFLFGEKAPGKISIKIFAGRSGVPCKCLPRTFIVLALGRKELPRWRHPRAMLFSHSDNRKCYNNGVDGEWGSACDATAQKSISIRRVRRRRRRVRFRLGLGRGRGRNEMRWYWELGAGRDILTRRKKDRQGLQSP